MKTPDAPPAGAETTTPQRLFERDPYDEIVLADEAGTVVRVLPLDLPGRRLPENPKPNDKLIARTLENPTEEYEVRWADIAQIRLFEQLVLAEAEALVGNGKYNEAYDYFEFLKRNHPDLSGLQQALAAYLYAEAEFWQRQKDYEHSLALLYQLHQVDPTHGRLERAIGAATDKLVEHYAAKADYDSARRLIRNLSSRFPQHSVVSKWEQQWIGEARQRLSTARELADDAKLAESWQAAYAAIAVWPRLPEAEPFFKELSERYPRISVGVLIPAGREPRDRVIDWAVRRNGRLLHRLLLEYAGTGPEGGEYICPIGQFEKLELGSKLVFRLRRDIGWSAGEGTLSGFDVARRLLALGDMTHGDGRPAWSELLASVGVRDVYEVEVDLNWSHVRPEAMLDIPLFPLASPAAFSDPTATVGPYRVLELERNLARYVANEGYFAAEPGQAREIIEHYFEDSAAALAALRQGRIQLIDRVNPWDVGRLEADDSLVTQRYALPSVHCLLPNLQRPFTAQRSLRLALVYGINRQLILDKYLLRGKQRPGCQVVSGPFPAGLGLDDPLRYAYNPEVEPRPWDPRLAIARAGVALHQVSAAAKAKGQPEVTAIPPLVLAHPPHEIARIACRAIQRHLEAVKIPIQLEELDPGVVPRAGGDYDLLYAELVMQEPVVDARRLLGSEGFIGGASPWIGLALRELDAAAGWKEARQQLQRIHRLAAEDVAVVPLWQLTEHFAYRKSLTGIGETPVSLYQNVERWQGEFQLPAEEP